MHEKVGNANQSKDKDHLTPVRLAIIQKTRDKCWPRREKREPCGIWWNVNWCSHYGTTSMEVPQKTKITTRPSKYLPLLSNDLRT